jgi:hypothetical protein
MESWAVRNWRGWRLLAVASVALMVTGAACGKASPSVTYHQIATSLQTSIPIGYEAGLQGVLEAGVNQDGSVCLWVENPPSYKTYLVWPAGYKAGGTPLRVFDQHQQALATVGLRVVMRGGRGPNGSVFGCPPNGASWIVAGVSQLN